MSYFPIISYSHEESCQAVSHFTGRMKGGQGPGNEGRAGHIILALPQYYHCCRSQEHNEQRDRKHTSQEISEIRVSNHVRWLVRMMPSVAVVLLHNLQVKLKIPTQC